jgi:putative phage-type endonuclease
MIQTIHAKNHDEWLTLRKKGIGSSEVGTIMGVNPYDTPYQLWLRKTEQAPAIEENVAMKMGHKLEPIVAQLYEEYTGNVVDRETEDDFVVINDLHPFMVASPDRYVKDRNGRTILLECKTTAHKVDEDTLPQYWFCQVQYLMACAELDMAAIAWLVNGREFGTLQVSRNERFVKAMLDKVAEFWKHVEDKTAPELTPNTDDVTLAYQAEEPGKIVTATDEIYAEYKKLLEVKAGIEELERAKSEIETAIKAHMQDAERLEYGDKLLATWKQSKGRETFDTKAFKADHADLAEKYTKTGKPVRTFLIKK